MKRVPLFALAALAAGCPIDTSFVAVDTQVETPSAAIASEESAVGYDLTSGACFRVPGVARGTGYALHPDLALGDVWTRSDLCGTDLDLTLPECMWAPSLLLYNGAGISENARPTTIFHGVTRFDDSASSGVLGQIFGTSLTAGALAELSSVRVYDGTINLRDPDVAAWLDDVAASQPEGSTLGFSWNVTVFNWTATFLVPWDHMSDDDKDSLVSIDGQIYHPSGSTQAGYEVFACVAQL